MRWIYSHTEIMDRVRAAFAIGTFTFQELQVICPFIDPRLVNGLIRKGKINKIAPGIYYLPK